MTSRVQRIIIDLFRLSPEMSLFMGAVFLSNFVNLFTNAFGQDQRPARFTSILLSAGASVVAAGGWSSLGWRLSTLYRATVREAPAGLDPYEIWERTIQQVVVGLCVRLTLALLASVAALTVLIH